MADGALPPPLLSLTATATVVAAAGALGFGIVYWATPEAPRAAAPQGADNDGNGNQPAAQRAWTFPWPWTTRTASQQAGACSSPSSSLLDLLLRKS